MKRTVIKIDEGLCNGCGLCAQGCHEGALQIIGGKARVINEVFCDGLGACIGECPIGAIEFEEKEAEPYDEYAVMARLTAQGEKTVRAHLRHLKEHNEMGYFTQGVQYLQEHGIRMDMTGITETALCGDERPAIASVARTAPPSVILTERADAGKGGGAAPSCLAQWPVQLHLLNPQASYFKQADVVLAADCVAYAYGDFHRRFLKNRVLAIACPKLDAEKEKYINKLTLMMDKAAINTLTVVIMEVPCCAGLLALVRQAADRAEREMPIKKIVVSIKGNILE